jgi:hypothetical protein
LKEIRIECKRKAKESRTHNKPLAFMAADVITQASVFRRNISDYPQYSLLETAMIAIAKTLAVMLRTNRKKETMTLDNKILKINRHLFNNGTSKLNRVLRSFVPRGSTPRCFLVASSDEHRSKRKGEEQSSNAQSEIGFARQEIPFGQSFKLNLTSPSFGVLPLFHLTTI